MIALGEHTLGDYQASKKTENRGRPIQIPRSSFDSENVAA